MTEETVLKNALRYEFAKCCFLDIADFDYIAARTLFRNCCYHQSLILMQQAVEKYLKAILLYNRIAATNDDHKIKKLLIKCLDKVQNFKLSYDVVKFIQELDGMERSRYLTVTTVGSLWLTLLDKSIWQLRVFAQPDIAENQEEIKQITTYGLDKHIGSPIIFDGNLEKILSGSDQDSMTVCSNLVWQNQYYFKKIKKHSTMNLTIGVLPLISLFDTDNPQTKKLRYEAVKDLIRIPKDVKGELDKL